MRIYDSDIPKTALIIPEGLCEWLVMPFGQLNAPEIFSRVINDVFRDLLGKIVMECFDDRLAYSKKLNKE